MDEPFFSIVIPVYNGTHTIDACLQAASAIDWPRFEVIVVDDMSTDGTGEKIARHPVRHIKLSKKGGASGARNAGVDAAKGEFVFFIDADCVPPKDLLRKAARALQQEGSDVVIGGTYTPLAHDHGLFSSFQSVFVNYSETKYREPDYIATHAMLMPMSVFRKHGRFDEHFLPILEDVELCHRWRRQGVKLVMRPELQVAHIFRFTLWRSMKNAYRKSRWWTLYSLRNKDYLTDSGTASVELKSNVVLWAIETLSLLLYLWSGLAVFVWLPLGAMVLNAWLSRRLLAAYFRSGGSAGFALGCVLYYFLVYPIPVALGSLRGLLPHR